MAEPRRCANCGAHARLAARFCEYCGVELPQAEAAPQPSPSPFGDVNARFAALEAHPDLAKILEHRPSESRVVRQSIQAVFGIVFLGIVGLIGAFSLFAFCPPLGLLPLAIIGVAIAALVKQLSKATTAHSSSLERVPALVLDERTKISGGGNNSSSRTEYFATLQQKDGTRKEYDVAGELAGRIVQGDLGVAFLKGDYLLDFVRLGV